jgi:hypothetical protein
MQCSPHHNILQHPFVQQNKELPPP